MKALLLAWMEHQSFGRLVGDELVLLERLRALIHAINVERAEGRADLLQTASPACQEIWPPNVRDDYPRRRLPSQHPIPSSSHSVV